MGKRKRVTRPFFVYQLRETFRKNLIEQGFTEEQAYRLAFETDVAIGAGLCEPKPPRSADDRVRECLMQADRQLKAAYAV